MPYPLSEAVAIFEDVQRNHPLAFLAPQGSYYRPLFYMTLSAIWHTSGSVSSAIASIKLLHIVPATALVVLFVWHVRPKTALEGAAATFALSVLVGSPAFLGNLELPLSYTIVGMPLALMVWMLLEREYRRWHGPVIVMLVLLATGFKEQGLVLVPLIVAAWWAGAPGIRRGTVGAVVVIAIAYVGLRLYARESWEPFEQNVGFGFTMISPSDAEERFGAFPLWIYAYNGASTIANLLWSEPTDGVFRIVRDVTESRVQSWEVLYVLSSLGLTGLIAWWGVSTVRRAFREGWSPESRACVAVVVATIACGLLSFNYSRDRLGGMALVFYALAAFFAVRAVADRALRASTVTSITVGLALILLAGAWQLRATYTLEYTRQRAINNRREWLTNLQLRREDFAKRRVYLSTMEAMVRESTAPHGLVRTQYPRWLYRVIGE
jgi:hypothetical protein